MLQAVPISQRVYPTKVQRLLQVLLIIALAVFVTELYLILAFPETGLRLLWFATIPLAPMILLVAPNAWVSVCPISTVQTFIHRLGRNPLRRLSPKATQRLQATGWALMLAGIPSRHLVFNTVGWATFFTALIIMGAVLVAGFMFQSLSGWCVGICPIRPIEVLYGQFALDKNRPEKCTQCTACVPSCMRLVPEKSHGELFRSAAVAHMAMGFPGFVAAYFLLDLANWCPVEHDFFAGRTSSVQNWAVQAAITYGVIAAGFLVSWGVFASIRRWVWDERKVYVAVAMAAFSAYYLGVAPEICEAWNWPIWVMPLLLVPPLAAVIVVLIPRRQTRTRQKQA